MLRAVACVCFVRAPVSVCVSCWAHFSPKCSSSLTAEEIEEEKARQAVQEQANQRQGKDEDKAAGAVRASTYWGYFRAGANPVLILFTFAFSIAAQASYVRNY